MDKLYEFEIQLRGDAKDQPPHVVVKYQDLRGHERVKHIETVDAGLAKALFSEGVTGEFWYDIFSGIEAAEGIE